MKNSYGIIAAFDALDRETDLPDDLCDVIRNSTIDASQGISLAVRLLLKAPTAPERETILHLFRTFPAIQPLLAFIYADQVKRIGYNFQFAEPNLHPDDAEMLCHVFCGTDGQPEPI